MEPDNYRNLTVSADSPVLRVGLNRPDTHNALNADLIEEVTVCFDELSNDEQVRAVVLSGAGRSFCAGADIGYMRDTAGFSYEENLEDARNLAAMFRAVEECPKPVVAKVRGAAIGGGAGLVAAVDVAVAEESAVFSFSEVRLGIAPATIAPFVVRKVGHSHARRLFLTGERFKAEQARAFGLVHEVIPEDGLDAAVEKKVGQLLKGGPEALAATKALLRELREAMPEEATGLMAHRIADLRTGEEGQEGLGAFIEKRDPSWKEGS